MQHISELPQQDPAIEHVCPLTVTVKAVGDNSTESPSGVGASVAAAAGGGFFCGSFTAPSAVSHACRRDVSACFVGFLAVSAAYEVAHCSVSMPKDGFSTVAGCATLSSSCWWRTAFHHYRWHSLGRATPSMLRHRTFCADVCCRDAVGASSCRAALPSVPTWCETLASLPALPSAAISQRRCASLRSTTASAAAAAAPWLPRSQADTTGT